MKTLTLYNTESIDTLVWPEEHQDICITTPALSVFTDLHQFKPLVIDGDVKAIELEKLMKQAHVKMKFVLDQSKKFIGINGLDDLQENKIIVKVSKYQPREELLVTDFMRPRSSLKAFDYEQLAKSTVGDVLETQKNNHQQHCLVVDRAKHEIRGLISASDVARALKLPVDINNHISFEDLFNELAV
jgi:CBS domain containing-hemolysin-like protein